MIVTNATTQDVKYALDRINDAAMFKGNLEFIQLFQIGNGSRVNFRIKAKNCREPGGRLNHSLTRHVGGCACWHAHGHLFDALFEIAPNAVIRSSGIKITRDDGNWTDRNIGSMMQPLMYSEACHCEGTELDHEAESYEQPKAMAYA